MPRHIAAICLLSCALSAQGDMVELKDGRFVMDRKMSGSPAGVTVHFENGDVLIPASMIRLSTVNGTDDGGGEMLEEGEEDEGLWLLLRRTCRSIVFGAPCGVPVFSCVVVVAILFNTVLLALEHHGQSAAFTEALNNANLVKF